MSHETKQITAQIKQATEAGDFEAVIATLNVIDRDGDIVMPGCLAGKTLTLLPAHESWHVPLGKAKIEERGEEAVAVGRFNLDVRAAQDWHAWVKFDLENPPALQQYSWDLIPLETQEDTVDGQRVRRLMQVDSKEMSLVLRGASINTRTLAVKSFDVHQTETSDAPFDVIEQGRRFKGDISFLHHFITDEGDEGAASTRACHRWISWLNTEGLKLAQSERVSAYAHLAAHLKDADETPSDLASPDSAPGLKLIEQVRFARWEVDAAIERVREVSHAREKRGQELGQEVRAGALELAAEVEELGGLLRKLDAMSRYCEPDDVVAQAMATLSASRARHRRA